MEKREYLCRCVSCEALCDPADFVSKSTNYLKLTKRCLKCRNYSSKIVRRDKISKIIQAQK
jgi:hypothetical protein